MKCLIKNQEANPVTEEDIENFDPALGPCCHAGNFRLHLSGTPCDYWNKSAAEVFVESFLIKHVEYPSDEAVVDMVKFKTNSTIAAMIRRYRTTGPDGNVDPEMRKYQNRQERKRKASLSSIYQLRNRWLTRSLALPAPPQVNLLLSAPRASASLTGSTWPWWDVQRRGETVRSGQRVRNLRPRLEIRGCHSMASTLRHPLRQGTARWGI